MDFLGRMSCIHDEQGDYGAALSLLAEAETLAREAKDDTMLATTLIYLGSLRRRLGDRPGAEAALNEALPMARAAENTRVLAEALSLQSALRLSDGSRDGAAGASKDALQAAKALGEQRLVLLTRLQAGEVARSVADLQAVAQEADSAGLAPIAALAHLALARTRLAARHFGDALRDADLATASARRLGQKEILFQALHVAGQSLRNQGDEAGAADRFRDAILPLEEMSRALQADARKTFLARPDTVEFVASARRLFLDLNRRDDAERLERLLRS
jgi:hypothetical protein